jgi:1-pyrroline-5-carboxylate dehydrogenase
MKMGSPEDMSNFITAVISKVLLINLKLLTKPRDTDAEVIWVEIMINQKGTLLNQQDHKPKYSTMETELFGPVVTIYVYEDAKWAETLELVDTTSEYALTGAVFSQDRYAIEEATVKLQNAAGNYINDKPTGAL